MLTTKQKSDFATLIASAGTPGGVASLREWVYDSYKDIEGVRGHWAMHSDAQELADWIVRHFELEGNCWVFSADTRARLDAEEAQWEIEVARMDAKDAARREAALDAADESLWQHYGDLQARAEARR
jgi:hypothetical protein